MAKLSDESRREIIALANSGASKHALAAQFGVSRTAVIKTLRAAPPEKSSVPRGRYETKLSAEQRDEIRRLAAGGQSRRSLGRQFSVSHPTIMKIVGGSIFR